jgi:hypothetical protein
LSKNVVRILFVQQLPVVMGHLVAVRGARENEAIASRWRFG